MADSVQEAREELKGATPLKAIADRIENMEDVEVAAVAALALVQVSWEYQIAAVFEAMRDVDLEELAACVEDGLHKEMP